MGGRRDGVYRAKADAEVQLKEVDVKDRQCSFVVMVCADVGEADQVSRQLLKLNSGRLVTYRRVEDLALNTPAGRVAMVILSTYDELAVIRQTLRWLHHRWPGCNLVVVGSDGASQYEVAAREGRACYLTRPVAPDQWTEILQHILARDHEDKIKSEKGLSV